MMQKVLDDPRFGPVTLRKNTRARRLSLRVKPTGEVVVTLPFFVPYRLGLEFLYSREEWVLRTQERLKGRIGAGHTASPEEIEELRRLAKAELPQRLSELARVHGFEYSGVRIKHNSSNWGSCSRKGNINLNLNLMRVPEELREYVMLHELCHLRHPNHGAQFHLLLESLCPDHRRKERELKAYTLI